MGSNSVDLLQNSVVHFSGIHLNELERRGVKKEKPTSSTENAYRQPFIIGVAGGASSGKTTVCNMIIDQLRDQGVALVNQESFYYDLTDDEMALVHDYNFDHPDAFDTEKLLCCLENLKHGQAIEIPNYDFKTHKSILPSRKVNPAGVVILEGILVFHDHRLRNLMNMKIFVDTAHSPEQVRCFEDLKFGILSNEILCDSANIIRLSSTQHFLDVIMGASSEFQNSPFYYGHFGALKWSSDADLRLSRRICRDTFEKGRDIEAVLDQYSKFVKPAFEDFILPTKKYADIIMPRGGDNHVAIDLIVQHICTKLGQHELCKIYPNLYVIQSTFQIRGMHTLIRDAQTTKHDFIFYSDRLIRLVVEHGLGHLPFQEKQVMTPTGSVYTGVEFCKRLCGISIIRSGESMENALRACCKGIKIGKILIHREGDNGQQLIYQNLPKDISNRRVLLLDPILGTGNSAVQAISLLLEKGVDQANIIFLNLISAPQGVHVVCKRFPRIKIVTSEIEQGLNEDFRVIPGMGEFGDRYFGTDDNYFGTDDD